MALGENYPRPVAALVERRLHLDFPRRVAMGLETGCSLITIHGHNGDIDSATTPEDVWEGSGLYAFPSSAQSLEILSDDAGDTSAGTGARTVRVETLDGNYDPVTQTVSMNGTTPVALTGTHLRVNKAQVITSGSSESNEGVISVRVVGPGATLAVIDNNGAVFGDGIAHNGIYTVPARHQFMFVYNLLQMLKPNADTAHCMLRVRPFGESWRTVTQFGPNSQGSGAVPSESPATPVIGEKTDIRYTVSVTSTNNVAISVFGVAILMPTNYLKPGTVFA